jgi:hypothetical protein
VSAERGFHSSTACLETRRCEHPIVGAVWPLQRDLQDCHTLREPCEAMANTDVSDVPRRGRGRSGST